MIKKDNNNTWTKLEKNDHDNLEKKISKEKKQCSSIINLLNRE